MAPPHKPSEAEFDALEDTLRGILHNLTVLGHATLDFSNQNVVNENMWDGTFSKHRQRSDATESRP